MKRPPPRPSGSLRCLAPGLADCDGCRVCVSLEQLAGAVAEPLDLELAIEASRRLADRRAS